MAKDELSLVDYYHENRYVHSHPHSHILYTIHRLIFATDDCRGLSQRMGASGGREETS